MIGKDNSVYVGATIRRLGARLSGHKYLALKRNGSGKFCNSIRRNGWDFFTPIVLSKANNLDELYDLEKCFIRLFDSYKNGLNGSTGGRENQGIIVTKKRINTAKIQMQRIYNSSAIKKARKNSLTSEKQRARSKKHHDKNRLKMPKYEVICRATGEQIGVFQGYKHVSEKLGYHPNTVRVCLSRGYPTRKYFFRYMEV